jgi:uncharacterized GH25 family protein
MWKTILSACALFTMLVISASAHDLFLKLDAYFLQPNSKATVRLMNGTFQSSDGKVARDRVRDVTVVTPDHKIVHPESSAFRDEGEVTLLDLETSGAGTYLVGLSTKPKEIDLKAADFNDYLKHDGIPDILDRRAKRGEMGKDVRERYSKHVKALLQVGDARTDSFKIPLNYPLEIIPQQNPYSLKVGETLEVQCLKDGKPIDNQFVIAGFESGSRMSPEVHMRTDKNGKARFNLKSAGKWYVKLIHMEPLEDPNLNYESKWATLTFELR